MKCSVYTKWWKRRIDPCVWIRKFQPRPGGQSNEPARNYARGCAIMALEARAADGSIISPRVSHSHACNQVHPPPKKLCHHETICRIVSRIVYTRSHAYTDTRNLTTRNTHTTSRQPQVYCPQAINWHCHLRFLFLSLLHDKGLIAFQCFDFCQSILSLLQSSNWHQWVLQFASFT